MMKICTKCKQEKELSEFHKHSKTKDGYKFVCKKCRKEQNKLRYNNNKSKIKEIVKLYQKTHIKERYIARNEYRKCKPWVATLVQINQRCLNINRPNYKNYGGRGIKCLITSKELKEIWFRDKAYLLDRPSIDRIDNDGNYEYSNCRYIEMSENSKKQFIDKKLKKQEKIK